MPFRFGRSASKPEPASGPSISFDPAGGVPEAQFALQAATVGDWRAVEERFGHSTDWAARSAVVTALRRVEPFDGWIEACPDSALAHSVRADQLVRLAWEVRGSGKAATVRKDAWGDFFAILDLADKELRIAVDLAPEDPGPWAIGIIAGMGLEVPKDEILRRFEAACERDPGFAPAWLSVVTATAAKWGGSHELMFDIARRSDRDLPDGSPGRVGIVRAHEERRLYLAQWENDLEAARGYMKRPEVVLEVSDAASRSVLSMAFRPDALTRLLQSWFAFGLAMVGDGDHAQRIRAAQLFAALDQAGVPGPPWTTRYALDRAGAQYVRIAQLCYKAAAGG